MLKVTLIALGKIKEKASKSLIEEYSKRLQSYCQLRIVELDDEKCPETLSERQKEQLLEREGEKILSKIPPDAFIIPLVIEGKQFSSEEFSKKMDRWQIEGLSHICLIIGGSLGLSRQVEARGNLKMSFSKMTFPHQLMRVILLEQIYRAFRISRGEPYHK